MTYVLFSFLSMLYVLIAEPSYALPHRFSRFGLTYMATLANLVRDGKLKLHEADLEDHQQPHRYVYFTLEVDAWITNTLRNVKTPSDRDLSPLEQLEDRLYGFVIGRKMTYGSHFHPLRSIGDPLWEIKTADVRLIGWFPRRGNFLATCGRLKNELLGDRFYKHCILNAVFFRNTIDLDEPKAIVGVKADDVL